MTTVLQQQQYGMMPRLMTQEVTMLMTMLELASGQMQLLSGAQLQANLALQMNPGMQMLANPQQQLPANQQLGQGIPVQQPPQPQQPPDQFMQNALAAQAQLRAMLLPGAQAP
jgi:hypothetical protein